MKISLMIGLALIAAPPCFADLKFAAERVELKAGAADEKLAAEFAFENTGKEPVELTGVEISCSCLSTNTDKIKKTYAPGESGKVEVVFKLGSFTGYQKKTLTVVAGKKRTLLTVGVQIPNVITITPNIAEWTVGEKPTTKVFKVLVEHPEPIKITEVSCKREGFAYELKTVKEGREYEISLTPESTGTAMLGMLGIQTDCKIPKHQRQMAFYAISRPKRAAAPGVKQD